MNILFICGSDPRDKSFGNPQRTNFIWQSLKKLGNVYTICNTSSDYDIDDTIRIAKISKPEGIKALINWPIEKFWNYFDNSNNLRILPYPVSYADFPYSQVKFDIIVLRYLEVPSVMKLWRYAPVFIDIDDYPNIEVSISDLFRRYSITQFIAQLLRCYRVRYIERHISGAWVSNYGDICRVHNKRVHILRNIPQKPADLYDFDSERSNYIFSVGFMGYKPNYSGVDHFLDECWPIISNSFPDLKYYIIGKGAPDEYQKKWSKIKNVDYLGYVNDLASIYQNSLATVVPILKGSGTCIKTIESLSFGRQCFSFPMGLRGIPEEIANDSNGFHSFYTGQEFIEKFKRFVLDNKKMEEVELEGRKVVSLSFNMENFTKDVFSLLFI